MGSLSSYLDDSISRVVVNLKNKLEVFQSDLEESFIRSDLECVAVRESIGMGWF